jgi:hypothetical protein
MNVKSISVGLVFISMMAQGLPAHAACNAVVNNRPMTMESCRRVIAVYGYVTPGHYLADDSGNWIKLDEPYAGSRGNIYRDARGSGGSGDSYGGGMTRTPFGSVGGGYYFDPETGASVGPD